MIELAQDDFDPYAYLRDFEQRVVDVGAIVSFIGRVRPLSNGHRVKALFLQHYETMTRASIQAIADAALQKWPQVKLHIVHRVGYVKAGQPIVCVLAASPHRREAIACMDFTMDHLKSQVLLWKQEIRDTHTEWIEPRVEDYADQRRWEA